MITAHGEYMHVPGSWHTTTAWNRSSRAGDPSRPCSGYLFVWLFMCMCYNVPVINNSSSKVLSWVLWAIPSNYWTWKGSHGNPQFIGSLSEVLVAQTWDGVWSWGSLVGVNPYPAGSVLTTGSIRIELNCGTPSWCPQKIGEFLGLENPHIWWQKCGG